VAICRQRRDRKPGAICRLNDYLQPYASVIQRPGTAVFSTDLQGLNDEAWWITVFEVDGFVPQML
jgi:hypothetical protein